MVEKKRANRVKDSETLAGESKSRQLKSRELAASDSQRPAASSLKRPVEPKSEKLAGGSAESPVVEFEGMRTDEPRRHRVFVRTFGYFDVFVDGRPVIFGGSKEKELLALLVDCNGGTLRPERAISYLWEDGMGIDPETLKSRYRTLCYRMRKTLANYGVEYLVTEHKGVRCLNHSLVTCDLYEFLRNRDGYRDSYFGEYLADYSWGEFRNGRLAAIAQNRRACG